MKLLKRLKDYFLKKAGITPTGQIFTFYMVEADFEKYRTGKRTVLITNRKSEFAVGDLVRVIKRIEPGNESGGGEVHFFVKDIISGWEHVLKPGVKIITLE